MKQTAMTQHQLEQCRDCHMQNGVMEKAKFVCIQKKCPRYQEYYGDCCVTNENLHDHKPAKITDEVQRLSDQWKTVLQRKSNTITNAKVKYLKLLPLIEVCDSIMKEHD